jgi:hypothetical protein
MMLLDVPRKRRNGLDDQPNLDKENVPSSFGSPKSATKQQKVNKSNLLDTRGKRSNQALEEAMDAVERGRISLRKANRHWNIPLTLLFDHLYEKTRSKKVRSIGVLTTKKIR